MTQEITVDSPEIDETSGQAEDTKAKTEITSSWDGIPNTIQDLLSDPPVIVSPGVV